MVEVGVATIGSGRVPTYAHLNDAGADLYSNKDIRIPPHQHRLVGTGIKLDIPAGYVGLIHPRSGLALKQGVTVLNAPGVIDAGYHGEVGVILHNVNPFADAVIREGDRIAQVLIFALPPSELVLRSLGALTDRGEGGFGSTGA